MAGKVTVGCKLPNGIILEHPMDPSIKVEIAGLNKVTIIGAGYASTDVDADFWEVWHNANKTFSAVVSGAIFASKSSNDVKAIAKEFADRSTGLEPMKKKGDKRAAGVKTATTTDDGE